MSELQHEPIHHTLNKAVSEKGVFGYSGKPSAESVNQILKFMKEDTGLDMNLISDGYHTFGELYDHRIRLYILSCKMIKLFDAINVQESDHTPIWRSKLHHDGSNYEGWFIMGIRKEKGKQISYHLPITYWDECDFAETLDRAPEFDGHTSADVLVRLKNII
jgi:hypothetical protein